MSNSNNSSSNNGGSNDASTTKRKRIPALIPPNNNLGEDELLMKTFYDLMQVKADRGEFQRIRQEPEDRKAIFEAIRPSFAIASASALATFVFLRKVPRWYMNRALGKKESRFYGRDGHPHYDSSRNQKNALFPRIKTLKDGSTSFHEGLLIKPLTIAIDLTVSLATGAAVWFYTIDKKGTFDAISNVPLVEGRSAVSDTLCADFIDQKNKLPKKLWTEYNDDAVTMLRKFIENCQRRTQYERQLRIEKGLEPEEPVIIPPPGVPPDMVIEDEEEKAAELYAWVAEDDWAAYGDEWDEEDNNDDDDKGFWGG
jgi:hypothetical protein